MSYKSGPGPVPDRWLHCPRKSLRFIAGKFLAFKTPLSSKFDSQVPVESRFTPSMLFTSTKSYKVRIGLWIDLTNTSRFYDKEEVNRGYHDGEVAYSKVSCRGHGETPSEEQTDLFIKLCSNYISKHPLEIVGVHCTHGFNRTGFLLVAYMVEILDWSLEAAIQEFSQARPPGIYKGDYLQELYRRYGDGDDDVPPPPPRPDWCLEYDDSESNDLPDQTSKSEKRKSGSGFRDNGTRKRHKGKVPEFMEGINGVTPVLDQPRLSTLQQKAQEFSGFEGKGFPGSQPVSMDRENIRHLQQKPYRVSWKADGTRYMMLILGENQVYCLDRDNNAFEVSGLRFVHRKDIDRHITDTLLDGEMVIDRHEGKCFPRYLVYDIIRVNDIDVSKFSFYPERLACIDADVIRPRHKAILQNKIDKNLEPFSVRAKVFYPVNKAGSLLSEKFSRQLTHEPDGLIFQPSDDPYIPGQCPYVLKWKPASLNSVDFRLKIVTESGLGIVPKKIGELYVGGYERPYDKMKFTSTIKDLNNKIIECTYENNKWVFMRERTDKSFPNSYATAKAVCNSIMKPVTKEYLLHVIDHYRFKSDDELMPPPKR